MNKSIKVLLVCEGNTCRSAMAEVILTNIVRGAGRQDVIAKSAGTHVWVGHPMLDLAITALTECGEALPLEPHRATQLTVEMQKEFDHIIDLRQISDPVGFGTLDAYITTCKQLQQCMKEFMGKI